MEKDQTEAPLGLFTKILIFAVSTMEGKFSTAEEVIGAITTLKLT